MFELMLTIRIYLLNIELSHISTLSKENQEQS